MASVAQQRALLVALGMGEPDKPPDESAEAKYPSFDGGAREPAWWDPDPARSHDLLVLDAMLGRHENR